MDQHGNHAVTALPLNARDFARLLHGGACSHIARRRGIPPEVMTAPEPAELRWTDFPFENSLADFADEIRRFLLLPRLPAFEPEETLAGAGERLCADWARESGKVCFYTSGSTGEPEPHAHSSGMLCQEIEAVRPAFAEVRRFVCTTPLLHSYGFIFGFLLPRLSGRPAVILPALPSLLADKLVPGDLLISFPQLLGRVLAPPPEGVSCLTSTAPCPPGLFATLAELGFARTTEIYGSSESGALALRAGENDPFTLLPHWRKKDDVSVFRLACDDSPERILRLPDHIAWHDDRRLSPTGRIDKAVQVAGVNVYPERIAATLCRHPQVRECAVRPMRPEEGVRLKAFVVPVDGVDARTLRKSLKEFMKNNLATAERPARLSFGPSLPRTDAGKLCDWK